jgi:hypothetical protein
MTHTSISFLVIAIAVQELPVTAFQTPTAAVFVIIDDRACTSHTIMCLLILRANEDIRGFDI